MKSNNNYSFAHSFNTPYNLFHSLSYSLQNKKTALLSQDGKRQIIEGDMTESKFLSLLLLFFLIRAFKWISSSIQLGRFKIKRFEREVAERIFVPLFYSL